MLRDYQGTLTDNLRVALRTHRTVFGVIYRATNTINGKVYIGQTSQALQERIGDHVRKAVRHNSKGHFHAAIRLYGIEAFCWEILATAESREELNEKERALIEQFGTTDSAIGYNMKSGGDQPEFTEEAKRRIGEAARGIKRSEEFKENLRRISKGDGNPFFGKHHTESARAKNRAAHAGKKLAPEHVKKCIHYGESNWKTVITEGMVKEIRRAYAAGASSREIQDRFGITKNICFSVTRRRSWKWVVDDAT